MALFLLFMPIFSAPLEAIASFGKPDRSLFYFSLIKILGFIGLGYPIYLLTQPKLNRQLLVGQEAPASPSRLESFRHFLSELPGSLFRRQEEVKEYQAVELDEVR